MADQYGPRFERLDEQWELSEEQENRRLSVERDIARLWPNVICHVVPEWKTKWRGVLHELADDEKFSVNYMNGPTVMQMRDVIADRTLMVRRRPTYGAVLWVAGQRAWRSILGGAGKTVIQPFDLSRPFVAAEIDALDAWCEEIGMVGGNPSEAEGEEILLAAGGFAGRAEKPRPKVTDVNIPMWEWRDPRNQTGKLRNSTKSASKRPQSHPFGG